MAGNSPWQGKPHSEQDQIGIQWKRRAQHEGNHGRCVVWRCLRATGDAVAVASGGRVVDSSRNPACCCIHWPNGSQRKATWNVSFPHQSPQTRLLQRLLIGHATDLSWTPLNVCCRHHAGGFCAGLTKKLVLASVKATGPKPGLRILGGATFPDLWLEEGAALLDSEALFDGLVCMTVFEAESENRQEHLAGKVLQETVSHLLGLNGASEASEPSGTFC